MGKILTISNHKGGVGKTTSVASLGVALSQRGKSVLLVDLDAQRNLTDMIYPDYNGRGIFEALTTRRDFPTLQISETLALCPSSLDMVGIEKALALLIGDNVREITVLRSLLLPLREKYDYILLDCPPSLGVITKNALAAADGVIIPLTAEALPSKGLNNLLGGITQIREGLNKSLELFGILITRYNRRKINRLVEESLRTTFGDLVFKTKIRENVDISESPLYGKTILEYSPDSIGAKDYLSLADEIINR